jgi:hypothetical protein
MKRTDMIKKLQLAEAKAWVVMREWETLFGHNEQFELKSSAWNSLYSALLMLNLEPDRELRSQLIEADIKGNGVLGINFN